MYFIWLVCCCFKKKIWYTHRPIFLWNPIWGPEMGISRYSVTRYCNLITFPAMWSVTSWLCIDEIPEVAKNKVSKPKRYSLSKLRFCHPLLKRLIKTPPTCLRHDVEIFAYCHPNVHARKEGVVSVTAVVLIVSGRETLCVYIWKQKHFIWLLKVDVIMNPYLQQNSNAFYGRQLREPRRRKFWLCYDNLALLIQLLYVLLLV